MVEMKIRIYPDFSRGQNLCVFNFDADVFSREVNFGRLVRGSEV